MSDVLKATYADIKTVKTRGVCQIVLEMPIEGMQDAMNLLGAPVSGNEVWVAIARLKSGTETATVTPVRKGTLAQQAGILCGEPAFRRYLAEKLWDGQVIMLDLDMAADTVRTHCGVTSRADLDKDDIAATKFHDLRADYKLWLSGVEAAA